MHNIVITPRCIWLRLNLIMRALWICVLRIWEDERLDHLLLAFSPSPSFSGISYFLSPNLFFILLFFCPLTLLVKLSRSLSFSSNSSLSLSKSLSSMLLFPTLLRSMSPHFWHFLSLDPWRDETARSLISHGIASKIFPNLPIWWKCIEFKGIMVNKGRIHREIRKFLM